MNRVFTLFFVIISLFSGQIMADARTDLQQRLSKVNNMQANFTQVVKDAQGKLIQEGNGRLWLKQPDLFRWHMNQPDESILVSDGKTLWYYDPFVEQVTATWLKDAAKDTPLILITRNNGRDWNNYSIMQIGDKFELTPRASAKNLRPFTITIDEQGVISSFMTKETDGQTSDYQLSDPQIGAVNASQFTFTPPKGVTLDDQRK